MFLKFVYIIQPFAMIIWNYLILWPILLAVDVNAGPAFEMFFENITCSSNDPMGHLNKLSCYLSKNVKRRTFSIEMQFKKDMRHFLLNVRIVLPRKGGNDFTLLNLSSINGCELLSNKNQATFIKLGRSTLDRYGNIPHQCPFKKDILYYVRGFRGDMSLVPAFSFEAEMLLWFEFVVDRNQIIKGFLRSYVTSKRNNNRNVRN